MSEVNIKDSSIKNSNIVVGERKMELTKDEIKVILVLLNRTTLQGSEVMVFAQVVGKLNAILQEEINIVNIKTNNQTGGVTAAEVGEVKQDGVEKTD